jgi:hypothetical protein
VSNYGTFRKHAKTLPIAVGFTMLLSLLPATWLGWTSDVADLVRVPVTPFSHIGMMIKNWVRPSIEPFDLPTDEQERNDLAVAERDHYRQLYHGQMLRSTELADQLRMLQALPESALRNPQPPLVVSVDLTGMKPSDPSGFIELKLSRASLGRIREGDIAIVGRDIVGRIARVGMTRMELLPSTNKESGYLRAVIVPANPLLDDRPPLLAEILLTPTGKGAFTSEVPVNKGVQKGDLVVLDDPAWPQAGIGLGLGVVASIEQLDEAPLRQTITIVPRRRAREHANVIVLGTGSEATP